MNKIIDIIKDYQEAANRAINIFKNKYGVKNILEGWRSGLYKQTGKLKDEGLNFYAFHGIGLAAHFNDKNIDFDLAFFPEPRHDGFDLWRITGFIESNQRHYPEYRDKNKIENDFNQLISDGIIVKPKLDFSTSLYFFKDTLKSEIEEEE